MATPGDEETENKINILPDELMIYIFKYLTLDALIECEKVCIKWKTLAQDLALWKGFVLNLSGKTEYAADSEKVMKIITTHGECIRRLKLQYVSSYPLIEKFINQCPNLISIELVMCRISKQFEDDVKKLPNLKKINLKNSLIVAGDVEVSINYDDLKNLQYLSLSNFGLPIHMRDGLLHCKDLRHIFIEKITTLDIRYLQNLIYSKLHTLCSLHIYGGDAINDDCMFILSQCCSLKDLAIVRCENLTDEGLWRLTNLKTLEHLQLWNNIQFTEGILLRTLGNANFINLQSLSLSRVKNISPLIVDLISECYKKLKFIALYKCPRITNTDYEKQLKTKFRNIEIVLY